MINRVLGGVFGILSVFFLPWWMVLSIVLSAMFYFDRYYEVIIIGLIADVLYGSFYAVNFPYPITLLSLIFLYIISNFKKNLIAY